MAYYSTSRNNHSHRAKLIKFIRNTHAFGYLPNEDTCECYLCSTKLNLGVYADTELGVKMECDHIIPVSKFIAGLDNIQDIADAYSEANDISNLAPLCKSCNRRKGNRLNMHWISLGLHQAHHRYVDEYGNYDEQF